MAEWQDPATPLIWLTGGSLLFFCLIGFILFAMRKYIKRIKEEALSREALLIKHRTELLENTIQGQEKERKRLSAELHDVVASKLNVIHLRVDSIQKRLDHKEAVDDIQVLLTDTIEETRRIAYKLMPVVLDKFGLIHAFQEICETYSTADLNVKFESDLESSQVPKTIAIHLYRIVQELLNNSLKYAACSKVLFSLLRKGASLTMVYSDNGLGGVDDLDFEKGLGLRNIKGRMTLLNGEMEVKNQLPGIQFEFKIPLPTKND